MDDKLEYDKFILQQPYVNDVRQEIKNKKAIKKKAEEQLTLENEQKKAESEVKEEEEEEEEEEKPELPAHKKNLLDLGIIDIHPNLEKYKKQPPKYSVIPKSIVDPNAKFENINNLTDITRMISEKNNTFVLRSYVRILEYDVLFYYLLYNIIAINSLTKIDLKLLNRKLFNNPGLPDEKQKQLISNLQKRFDKLKNNIARQLKKYEINENFNGSNFYNFAQILERDKLYIFKQYCIGHNRKTRKEINSLKYNDYEDIGKFICIKSVGDIDKQFELSILDKYNLKYDTYKHHQSKEYSYYQTIAQPLVFHIDKENGDYNIKTILTNIRDDDENIQKKIDETQDNAPGTKICFGKGFSGNPSKEYKGFYNDTKRFLNPENASVKYNMEIQNPKLTKKTPLNYSRGVDTYLDNKIDKDKYFKKFVLDKQKFSSGDGGKTRNLMEQINDNIKIIKKFKHLILKKLYQYKELHPHLNEDLSNKSLKPIQIMVNEYLEKIIPDNIIESLIIEKRPYKYELNKVIKPYAIFESRLDTSSEVESLWSRRKPVSKVIFKCQRIDCPLADKEFTSLQALLLHTREYHSGNMWVCPRSSNGNPCGKEFKTLQDLREHDIKCHPIDIKPDESCFDDDPEKHGPSEEQDQDDDDEKDEEEEEPEHPQQDLDNNPIIMYLQYKNDSCFMDSMLVNLFVYKNPISDKLLSIIRENSQETPEYIKDALKQLVLESEETTEEKMIEAIQKKMITARQEFINYMKKIFESDETFNLRPEFTNILSDYGCRYLSGKSKCATDGDYLLRQCNDIFNETSRGSNTVFFLKILNILLPDKFREVSAPCNLHSLEINQWPPTNEITDSLKHTNIYKILSIDEDDRPLPFIIIQPTNEPLKDKTLDNFKHVKFNGHDYKLGSCIISLNKHYISIIGNGTTYYFIDKIGARTLKTPIVNSENNSDEYSKISLMFYYKSNTTLSLITKENYKL